MKEIDIYQYHENVFKNVGKDYALLTSGTIDHFNTMTVGWATFGVVWGKNVVQCFVRPSRFTYQFMEKNEYFTLSFYDSTYKTQLAYLGSHSGKNEDKVKLVGFSPITIDDSITFQEARITFLCKKIYYQNLDDTKITNQIKDRYYPRGDFHRFYIGEIIKVVNNQ